MKWNCFSRNYTNLITLKRWKFISTQTSLRFMKTLLEMNFFIVELFYISFWFKLEKNFQLLTNVITRSIDNKNKTFGNKKINSEEFIFPFQQHLVLTFQGILILLVENWVILYFFSKFKGKTFVLQPSGEHEVKLCGRTKKNKCLVFWCLTSFFSQLIIFIYSPLCFAILQIGTTSYKVFVFGKVSKLTRGAK